MKKLLTFRKRLLSVCVLTFLAGFSAPVFAGTDVLLTILDEGGAIVAELTQDELLEMEQVVIRTENEFIDGVGEFSGPLARDVIALISREVETVLLTAINDYAVPVPVSDFMEYDVIFALTQDGEAFSIRDKGPIWVIYPMSENVELQDRIYNDRLIWQLVKVSAH